MRGVAIGLSGIESASNVGIIERGKELAFLYASALVEKHAGDAASDFSGDGGAAARRDVTAGI
jgi:hypothetical protein